MAEWPESRQLASQYHSPSPTGIGFAQYASTGTVTPELWENIKHIEGEARRRPEDPAVEGWAGDMVALRTALEEEGIEEPLDRAELRAMVQTALNSGSGDTQWATLVDLGGILGLEYDEEEDKYK